MRAVGWSESNFGGDMKKEDLRLEDRQFFQYIKQAIFANPFSDERREIDKVILGSIPFGDNKALVASLAKKSEARIADVIGSKTEKIKNYNAEDRVLLEYGVLFSIYHYYCDAFDELIREQVGSNSEPCKVRFAGECLSLMADKGFATKEAERFFALFFQMRRAFYFIAQIVGESSSMKGLRRNLWNNIFTHDIGLYEQYLWNRMEDFSTMLLGETGTGKGMAAGAIGRSGYIPFDGRKGCFAESFTRAFVSLNLSQFPEQLLESELFGHKKGAFTGAIEGHEGIFSRCSPYGSIFLDEVGDVSVPVQIKLLKILQERTFSPVGSHQQKRFPGRVIAATNREIDVIRDKGDFRDDFYYRLCSDIIRVPPLRQRLQEDPGDLKRLLKVTVQRILGKASPELVTTILKIMKQSLPADYHWPGNVRELEQSVRRILLKQGYEGDYGRKDSDGASVLLSEIENGTLKANELMSYYCKVMYEKLGSYEAVARKIELDRRTVKKYIVGS